MYEINKMLTELPESEVDNLCNILYKEWPQSIQAINLLRTCTEWKKKKPGLDISVFYNDKNIQSGLFMLIYKSGCYAPMVTMYARDSYENEFEEVLSTFLEKCDEILTLSSISKKHSSILEKVATADAYKTLYTVNLITFSMDIDKAKNLEIKYPSDVEVKSLKKEHLKEIHDVWVFNDTYTIEELENCLELNNESAVGIFCKQTDRLLCRCLRSHDGSISALQTIEEARGKGYAKLLLKHVCKKLADLSIVPYIYTADFNETAFKTIVGAGFDVAGHMTTIDIGKSETLKRR